MTNVRIVLPCSQAQKWFRPYISFQFIGEIVSLDLRHSVGVAQIFNIYGYACHFIFGSLFIVAQAPELCVSFHGILAFIHIEKMADDTS